jgi:glutathione S-transferase
MKLLWSSRSPFARKVMIAAHELGLAGRIATERVVVNSVAPNAEVMRLSPLGKIPALLLDSGEVLFDSRVIVDYLDALAGGPVLTPADGRRWQVQKTQALADAIMEADLRWLDERLREPQFRLEAQIDACRTKLNSGLDALEADPAFGTEAQRVDVGRIAAASALAHLDFRFAELDWRQHRPRLADWHAVFSRRASMLATAFADNY